MPGVVFFFEAANAPPMQQEGSTFVETLSLYVATVMRGGVSFFSLPGKEGSLF